MSRVQPRRVLGFTEPEPPTRDRPSWGPRFVLAARTWHLPPLDPADFGGVWTDRWTPKHGPDAGKKQERTVNHVTRYLCGKNSYQRNAGDGYHIGDIITDALVCAQCMAAYAREYAEEVA